MDCMRANKAEVRRHDWNKLHCAARDGEVKVVKQILHEVLCGVDDRTPINETALHKAVRGNAVEICKILLLQGADPNLRNKGGRTPLYFVLKPEVAELLLQAGAETDVTDKWENSTPLEYIKIRRESENNPELDAVIEIIESWINVQAPFELKNHRTLLAAYKASIRDGKKLLRHLRFILVGPERVGKTSLKNALLGHDFNSDEKKTDGIASPTTCRIDIDNIDNWQKVVSDSGYNLSQIIAKKTTDELKKIVTSLSTELPPETPGLVVDEPQDDNDVNDSMPKDVTRLVKTYMKWSEDESLEEKTKLLFSIWDFAGHHLYYTMHQVFLSPRSIYCVVFDASKDLNSLADMDFMPVNLYQGIHQEFPTNHEMTNLEFLDFWLNSIFTHVSENPQKDGNDCPLSPPVFIVGTHLDQISGTDEEKKEKLNKIKSTIKSYLEDKPYVKHVVPEIYFVDNTLRPLGGNMSKLKKKVEEIMRKQPYMNESIPISWIIFEHHVMELRKTDINYISLQQARDEAKRLGIQNEKELFDMLHLLHNIGIIAFYGDYDRNNDALADMVVLNPQWLLDIFTKVITITKREEKWTEFKCCWRILEEKGILEEVLIHHVWKDFPEECRESLLQIMERFDLLCENKVQRDESDALGTGDNQYQRQFLVPCQLIPNEGDKGRVWESEPNAVVINIISKNGFLPEGLFHRLSVKAASWTQQKDGCQSKPPRLYYRQTELYLDEDHELILKMHVTKNGKRMIKVVIYFPPLEDDDNSIPTASMCKEVLVFIENSLNDLRTMWMKNITLDLSIPCYMCKEYDDHHHNLYHCLEKGKIGCNKSRCKTTFWQNLFSSSDATQDVCHPLKCSKNMEMNPTVTPSSTVPVVPETNNDNVNEPCQSVLISEITPSDLKPASNGLPPAKTNGTTVSVTGDNNTLIVDSQVNLCIWRQRCPLRTHAPVVVAICAVFMAIYLLVGCCNSVKNL